MFVQRMKEMLYNYLVNRNSYVFQEYKAYRKGKSGFGRVKSWCYLLKLTICPKHKSRINSSLGLRKGPVKYQEQPESAEGKRESTEVLIEKLSSYEVISFDLFDTLLLRMVEKPSDAFFFVGEKLSYPNLEQIRMEGERKARALKEKAVGNREVTLEEIWQVLTKETGIDVKVGIQAELAVEKQVCFANPYFGPVLQELRKLQKRGKRLIAVSDMYLSKEQLKEILVHVGIGDIFEEIFVSCEYGASKSDGKLYEIVKKEIGLGIRYIHVGDNYHADVKRAKKHGITPYYYKNVNEVGADYRPRDMSTLAGSVYCGFVNAYLHNGIERYDKAYELGFIYGGLFVLGYCRWIHDYFLRENVDKILFLARDGDILSKVYHRLFGEGKGEEEKGDSWEYVPWSRLVGTKMCAGYYKHDYFERFLYQKVNQNYSLRQIFAAMDLFYLFSDFSQTEGLPQGAGRLTDGNVDRVKLFLQENWTTVLAEYNQEIHAGGAYYRKVLAGCKKVVVVDVGWGGSGAVQLDYLVNQVWGLDCEIIGLLGGTSAGRSDYPNSSETLLYRGKIESFLFSQSHNRDIWEYHNPGAGHNHLVELLLTSPKQSFRSFFEKGNKEENGEPKEAQIAKKVQQGILDFVAYYTERVENGNACSISGRDAYAPIATLGEHMNVVKKVIVNQWSQTNVE